MDNNPKADGKQFNAPIIQVQYKKDNNKKFELYKTTMCLGFNARNNNHKQERCTQRSQVKRSETKKKG